MNDKKNRKSYQKSIFSVVVVFVFAALVFTTLLFIVKKTGLITPREANKEKEDEILREKNKSFYDIHLDERFYKNGWIAWDGDVYYYMNHLFVCQKADIGLELLEINKDNIKMKDGVMTYHVVNGDKYKFGKHGKIYKHSTCDDVIIYKGESEYEFQYENPPFYTTDYMIFVKDGKIVDYTDKKESFFLKGDGIERIEISGKNELSEIITDKNRIHIISQGLETFKKEIDESVIDKEVYEVAEIKIFLEKGLFYNYDRCSYNKKENKFYIITKTGDENGVAEGLSFVLP